MELLILNDVDYTQHVMMGTWKVQREEVTKTWEDALYQNHTDLLRFRIAGTFKLYFDDLDEYYEFLDTLENLRGVDNYIPATVYDLKTHSQKTSSFKFAYTLANDLPYYGNKKHDGFEVKIEEK